MDKQQIDEFINSIDSSSYNIIKTLAMRLNLKKCRFKLKSPANLSSGYLTNTNQNG